MSEPIIACPKCKTEIKLTESLAAPLIESTRREFEKQLAQKDADIARRETSLREQEAALSKAKEAIDAEVAEEAPAGRAQGLPLKKPRRLNSPSGPTLIKRRGKSPTCRKSSEYGTRSSRKRKRRRPNSFANSVNLTTPNAKWT